jgi:hypothetical protein
VTIVVTKICIANIYPYYHNILKMYYTICSKEISKDLSDFGSCVSDLGSSSSAEDSSGSSGWQPSTNRKLKKKKKRKASQTPEKDHF